MLAAIEDRTEREFYEAEAGRNAWSVRQLDEQIRSDLYKRTLQEPRPIVLAPEVAPALRPEDAFRSLYSFAVPGLPSGYGEAQLEAGLLANFQRFLEELGLGFYSAPQPANHHY